MILTDNLTIDVRLNSIYNDCGDNMIKKITVYNTDCTNPHINLATEKWLFDSVEENEVILYLWQNKNTVVIGKNQNAWAECDTAAMDKDGVTLARRISGGGAVFHDLGNVNFTFIANSDNYNLERQLNVIKTACKGADIDTEFSGRNDILAQGRKFSGNAFYNSGGRAFQHGTLLISADMEKMQKYLTPSKAKLASKSVKSVKSRVINLSELNSELDCKKMKEYMTEAFQKVYGLNAEIKTVDINADIENLSKEYGSKEYLYGVAIPFSVSCENRFNWGSIQLNLNVKCSVITDVQVFSDSMDHTVADKIKNALMNCAFEKNAIKKVVTDDIYSMLERILP